LLPRSAGLACSGESEHGERLALFDEIPSRNVAPELVEHTECGLWIAIEEVSRLSDGPELAQRIGDLGLARRLRLSSPRKPRRRRARARDHRRLRV
jgi:hypothetical protein